VICPIITGGGAVTVVMGAERSLSVVVMVVVIMIVLVMTSELRAIHIGDTRNTSHIKIMSALIKANRICRF
jgi:hypothetical protein